MSYTCYYYNGEKLPKKKDIKPLHKHACFSNLFDYYYNGLTPKKSWIVVPMEDTDIGDNQEWIFTEKEARYFLGVIKRYFGGIIKIKKMNYSLRNFNNNELVKCLMVYVDPDTIKIKDNRLNQFIMYKGILTLIRYLYETPYVKILKTALTIHKESISKKYRFSLMTILVNLHRSKTKTNVDYYGSGHSFATNYKLTLQNNLLKFDLKNLKGNYTGTSNMNEFMSENIPIITNKTHIKQLNELILK